MSTLIPDSINIPVDQSLYAACVAEVEAQGKPVFRAEEPYPKFQPDQLALEAHLKVFEADLSKKLKGIEPVAILTSDKGRDLTVFLAELNAFTGKLAAQGGTNFRVEIDLDWQTDLDTLFLHCERPYTADERARLVEKERTYYLCNRQAEWERRSDVGALRKTILDRNRQIWQDNHNKARAFKEKVKALYLQRLQERQSCSKS